MAHLVHEDKCSLKGTVNVLVCWVHNALGFDLCTTQLQVVVPQFVAAAGEREGRKGEGGREGEGSGGGGREREGGRGGKGSREGMIGVMKMTVSSIETRTQNS